MDLGDTIIKQLADSELARLSTNGAQEAKGQIINIKEL